MGLLSMIGDHLTGAAGGLLPDLGGLINPQGLTAADSWGPTTPPMQSASSQFDPATMPAGPSQGGMFSHLAAAGKAAANEPGVQGVDMSHPQWAALGGGAGQPMAGFRPFPNLQALMSNPFGGQNG